MKRPIFFDTNNLDLVIFKDLESDEDFYGMDNEVRNELVTLRRKYGSKESGNINSVIMRHFLY